MTLISLNPRPTEKTVPNRLPIRFEPLHPNAVAPEPATEGSAGADLKACFLGKDSLLAYSPNNQTSRLPVLYPSDRSTAWVDIPPKARVLVPLGFKAALPPGFEGQIRSRSGLALKYGLIVLNAPGTIDADYTGEWGVILQNTAKVAVAVEHGERIAQLVLSAALPHAFAWNLGVVDETTRQGGFGSTGR